MRKFEIPQSLMHCRPEDALNLKNFAKKRSLQLAPVDVFDSSYLQQLRVVNMMTNTSSNRNKAHLGLGALLLGLAFISWLVLLGGLAGVQKLESSAGVGKNGLEFEWWILWFDAFILFLAATGHFLGFRASHAAIVALLSVVTALSMIWCNQWNQARRGANSRRADTLFAGFLLVSLFNSLLILVLGTVPDESDGVTYRKGTGASAAGPNRGIATPAAGATVV